MLVYLAGSFALIIVFIKTPAIEFYTGGVIIGLFMLGIFLSYGITVVQTRGLEEKKEEPKPSGAEASSEQATH
jgi:hypothetical protein